MSELKRQATLRMEDQDEGQLKQVPGKTCAVAIENLPPELLEFIFKNVESPKDLLSCWNTTSTWRNVLQSIDFYFKMTLPLLLPYLNGKDLLSCSSVSKFWNGAVDACIQNAEDFGSSSRLNRRQRIVLVLNPFNMTSFLDTFTLKTDGGPGENISPTNPVVFRRVYIDRWFVLEDRPNDNDVFTYKSSHLLKCLEHHGQLVRHLHLHFDDNTVSYLNIIKLTRSCLEKTPNLRVLHIAQTGFVDVTVCDEQINLQQQEFNDFNLRNTWPPLEHLKVLKFTGLTTNKNFAIIANAYGPKLLYLNFGFKLMEPNQLIPGRFSCLQKIVYFLKDPCSGVRLGGLVQSSQCPLKHLTVIFYVEPDAGAYDGLAIAVSVASTTLESIHFQGYRFAFPRPSNFDITKFEHLHLPKLKVLKLYTFDYPSVEFLQAVCPALQTLTVKPLFKKSIPVLPFTEIPYFVLEHGPIYADLYSQHQFWNALAGIRRVDVDYLVYFNSHDEVERNVMSSNNASEERKVYTRHEYEAKRHQLEKDYRRRCLQRSKSAVVRAKKILKSRKLY